MRVSWIVCGVVVLLGSLVVIIGAAIALVVDKTASALDPEAEAHTPGTARFVADDATYEVLMVRHRRDSSRAAAAFRCTVSLANERTLTLDGSRQAVSTEVANTATIGSFRAVAGDTEVFCEADGGDVEFVVNKETSVGRVANWLLFGGVGMLLIGAGLILAGVFWKRTQPA